MAARVTLLCYRKLEILHLTNCIRVTADRLLCLTHSSCPLMAAVFLISPVTELLCLARACKNMRYLSFYAWHSHLAKCPLCLSILTPRMGFYDYFWRDSHVIQTFMILSWRWSWTWYPNASTSAVLSYNFHHPFCFMRGLQNESRASDILGKCITTWAASLASDFMTFCGRIIIHCVYKLCSLYSSVDGHSNCRHAMTIVNNDKHGGSDVFYTLTSVFSCIYILL